MEIKTILIWVLLLVYVVPSYIFGFQKLFGRKEKALRFKAWGYPVWFMRLLGFIEVFGSSLMLYEPTRVYGIALFALVLAGAVYTHIKSHDPKSDVMTPVYVGLHLSVIFLLTLSIA
ncbi:DoxX family protein [Mucilaginibacter sp. FT3.2]|uniref:DoxX family protein n=1 Tax=Mucilaginibacter sp. FT3.2 TaxID=2723090 RepID=UPI001607DFFC|nr:DoxX family protein [Mucilaginibacter sp. FT3.2]MBB6233198.1 putative membrane protein YphA (DoxX/SURF4 family) [Mucilaginibacter sp. FT3.2]